MLQVINAIWPYVGTVLLITAVCVLVDVIASLFED